MGPILIGGFFMFFLTWSFFGRGHAKTCKIYLLFAGVILAGIAWKFPGNRKSNTVNLNPLESNIGLLLDAAHSSGFNDDAFSPDDANPVSNEADITYISRQEGVISEIALENEHQVESSDFKEIINSVLSSLVTSNFYSDDNQVSSNSENPVTTENDENQVLASEVVPDPYSDDTQASTNSEDQVTDENNANPVMSTEETSASFSDEMQTTTSSENPVIPSEVSPASDDSQALTNIKDPFTDENAIMPSEVTPVSNSDSLATNSFENLAKASEEASAFQSDDSLASFNSENPVTDDHNANPVRPSEETLEAGNSQATDETGEQVPNPCDSLFRCKFHSKLTNTFNVKFGVSLVRY